MNARPLVSVIMSVYNGDTEHLFLSTESILKQTYGNIEFLIVDDGSCPVTADDLDMIASRDSRIQLFRQKNQGLTKALNWLIKQSRGTYVARQDADDISSPDRIEKQVAFFASNPDLVLLGTGCRLIDKDGKILGQERIKTRPSTLKRLLRRTNQFVHGSVMFRADILRIDGNTYSNECRFAQDYDLFLRISEKYMVANIDQPLYQYRINPEGISLSKIREQLHVGMIVRKAAQMRRKGIRIDWSQELYDQIESILNTPTNHRRLEHLVSTAKGRNLLLAGKKSEARRMFLRAFFSCPRPKSLWRLLSV